MKVLQITIGFLPVLSLAAVLEHQKKVTPGTCVGIAAKDIYAPDGKGSLEYQGFGESGTDGSNPKYQASSLDTYKASDLCGKKVNGQVVTCKGDVSKTCSAYGVATYNNLNCRTVCTSKGDAGDCWRSDHGSGTDTIYAVIICDQTL